MILFLYIKINNQCVKVKLSGVDALLQRNYQDYILCFIKLPMK